VFIGSRRRELKFFRAGQADRNLQRNDVGVLLKYWLHQYSSGKHERFSMIIFLGQGGVAMALTTENSLLGERIELDVHAFGLGLAHLSVFLRRSGRRFSKNIL